MEKSCTPPPASYLTGAKGAETGGNSCYPANKCGSSTPTSKTITSAEMDRLDNSLGLLIGITDIGLGAFEGVEGNPEGLEAGEEQTSSSLERLQTDAETIANDCGGGLSFTYLTAVGTAQGKQAIGSLKPGEKVQAYNPQTKKMELEPIMHVWINHDNDLEDLTLVTTVPAKKGKPAQQVYETIHTNKKHPFLTQEYGFLPVASCMSACISSKLMAAWA